MFNWQHFLSRAGRLTITLVAISTMVSLLTWWGTNQYSEWIYFNWFLIKQGEVWRLISPIFMHFIYAGLPIHLLFNMMWLWDLGGSIEKAKGPYYLLMLILVIGIGSNFAQYFSVLILENRASGFGGMSGVVYGLLGFIYLRAKLDRFFPLRLNDALMKFMLIWLVLGFTGLIGNIANGAHLSGLVIGAALGFITAKTKKF